MQYCMAIVLTTVRSTVIQLPRRNGTTIRSTVNYELGLYYNRLLMSASLLFEKVQLFENGSAFECYITWRICKSLSKLFRCKLCDSRKEGR